MPIDKDAVVRLFSEKMPRPLTLPELEAHLALSDEDKTLLPAVMDELVHAGQVVALRGQRYGAPQRMNLLTGILQAHANGYAFLIPDKPGERSADVFIGRNELADAMHGDKVVVRIERTGKMGRAEGRVIRILERRVRRVVGEYQQGSGFGYVVPEEGRHLHHIYIPKGMDKRALSGQIVLAEIRQYPEGNRDPEGEIIRVLGTRTDPDVEREMIVERYGLTSRFPNEVLTEAKMVPHKVDDRELGPRVDLRGLKTVTIDGEHSKDFDDAVSIARNGDGKYKLWVSIADVAHYVRPGSPLDVEAKARATSVYFTDAVIPMLPEELSNGICSLNPHVERLALTAELEFDSEGKLINRTFYDSVIVSKERLTYTQVKQMLADRDEDLLARFRYLESDLRLMEELALKLKARRDERGSLDFDLPQPDILLDMEGNIEAIVRSERNIAHRMVEEFMLAANEAVASFLTKEGAPVLFRCHDEPDPVKVEDLRYFLHNLNLKIDTKVTPKALQRLLKQVQGRPLEKLVNDVTLRTMKHAYYSPKNVGHFGLASEEYLHFTSPIRRYPDLIVHRMLKSVIERGGMSERQREEIQAGMVDIAAHCSERERNSEKAEREALASKKVQFMQRFVGEEFDGYVSGVASFGIFVELREWFVDGLVHVSSLGDDYYEFREREHELLGQNTRRAFRLADKVRVKVARVDVAKRHIDFILVSDATREVQVAEPQAARNGRPVPQVRVDPAHPESGDGRGRLRRQNQTQAYSNRIPQRAPRPDESQTDDEDRRGRGERAERAERGNQRQQQQRPPRRDQHAPREQQAPLAAQPPAANETVSPLELSPPLSPDSPTVPPPVVLEGAPNAESAREGVEGEAPRKRRRRGGRGRRRRGDRPLGADGLPIPGSEGQGADDDAEGDDDTEESAAAPERAEAPVRAERAERAPRERVERPERAERPAPAEKLERAEPAALEQPAAPPAPQPTPERVVSAQADESNDDMDDDDDDDVAGGADGAEGAEPGFVAKRRRRRRGGRGRRRQHGDRTEVGAAAGEPAGEANPPPAPERGDGGGEPPPSST